MSPNVQQLLEASSALVALVGSAIYQNKVPPDIARPYVVWRLIASTPGNNLSDLPETDDQRVQVDGYSASQAQAHAIGKAARDAIEVQHDIVFGPWSDYEPETKLHRWSFDAQVIDSR